MNASWLDAKVTLLLLLTPLHCAAIWFLYLMIYGALPLKWSSHIYHLFDDVLATAPYFWLLLLLVPVTCVLPGFFVRQLLK